MIQQAHSQWKKYVLFALLILAILVPRMVALDRFVTADEGKWLARSANFYEALALGDFAMTYQKEHPGVTIMWAGMAGYIWRYPTYVEEKQVDDQIRRDKDIEQYLRQQGYQPLELMAAGRFFVVLTITITLAVSCFLTARLVGWWPALVGFALIAFDPFHVALSRQLHLDALLSCMMLLSILAYLNYLYLGRQRRYLLISALGMGLAWLTKLPGIYLVPFVTLLTFIELGHQWRQKGALQRTEIWQILWPWMALGVMSIGFFVLFWPVMWVEPINTLTRIANATTTHVVDGHGSQIFFNGTIFDGDPGWHFYLINYLWRTTPIVLIGLALVVLSFAYRALSSDQDRRVISALLFFVVLFTFFMTLGAKKFDRYLLPVYPILDLVAAMGWVGAASWLVQLRLNPAITRLVVPGIIIVTLIGQFALLVPTYPYYLSYYNPLLGGSAKAPEVMQIGWGEGLDEAARYLNTKPNLEQIQVMSWYRRAMFSYFFEGNSKEILSYTRQANVIDLLNSDYAVLYIHQWQRQLPNAELLTFFNELIPEKVIQINGLDYVRIYDITNISFPEFLELGSRSFIDWGGVIRLLAYKLPNTSIIPNEPFNITFYLGNRAPIDRNLSILIRLINSQQEEVLRYEGWPTNRGTTSWKVRDVWTDEHEFILPADTPSGYYRLELGFYEPATLERLPAQDARSGESIGDTLVVDYLHVGKSIEIPPDALQLQANLGQQINLVAAEFNSLDGTTLRQGETLPLRLFWQATEKINTNYTIFVHFIAPDGQIVSQADQQPLAGFLPTTFWQTEQIIPDEYQLQLPPDAPLGTYKLLVGMYDVTTGQRLPISVEGEVIGDAIDLGPFTVK